MSAKIVLVSDDTDFFDYVKEKLSFRQSDELFSFNFEQIINKCNLFSNVVLIVDSENSNEKVLELLKIFKSFPIIVFTYNDDSDFRKECIKAGAFDCLSVINDGNDIEFVLKSALKYFDVYKKNKFYRDILIKKDVLSEHNEVYLDYTFIIENELEKISKNLQRVVFVAISPAEKSKLLVKSNLIETVILNNIRTNDILLNFAANKYFLILYDSTLENAQRILESIIEKLQYKLYAGLTVVTHQNRQQLIDETLEKLHRAINQDCSFVKDIQLNGINIKNLGNSDDAYGNFKNYKNDFEKKIIQILEPVFYHIEQKYMNKSDLIIQIENKNNKEFKSVYLKNKNYECTVHIKNSGFSKINIDIKLKNEGTDVETKRIPINPEDITSEIIENIFEQIISEFIRKFS